MGIQYILAYDRCVVQTLVLSMSHSKGTGLTKQGAPGAIYKLGGSCAFKLYTVLQYVLCIRF